MYKNPVFELIRKSKPLTKTHKERDMNLRSAFLPIYKYLQIQLLDHFYTRERVFRFVNVSVNVFVNK